MKRHAIALLIAVATSAQAQTTIGLHMATAHDKPGFNESNPGLYVRLDNGFTAGSYLNSIKRQSNYLGFTEPCGPIAITYMAVTGYKGYAIPGIVPSIAIPLFSGVSARLSYVYSPELLSAVHLSLEYRL